MTSALRQHQIAQSAERGDTTDTRVDYGLVFTTPGGAPIHASNLQRRHFFPLITEVGVPRIRFHDLRHRHATLLLPNGVHPKIVSERLGHATVAITLDISSHVLPDMQQDALDGLQRRVFATA